jgi:hypothetical protein
MHAAKKELFYAAETLPGPGNAVANSQFVSVISLTTGV